MSFLEKFKNRLRTLSSNGLSVNIFQASKWSLYFIGIGIIAGAGSVVFHYLCQIGIHYFMDFAAGYRPPPPAGEHHLFAPTTTAFNRWILLFLPAFGGILSGWLVYTFAPEAEGHGTDAAIDAYHNAGGFIRGRVPIIKTIASALTLTTGGSGGREGPIAQIGAGFGSFLATQLKLSDRERRIMMAAGVGAGIGSIFRAPLAGALFAAEVLYRDPEFESEVIIPAGISSVVAYCTFCLFFGWGSLFESPDFGFQNPLELGPYVVLALILVVVGVFYVKSFYGVVGFFRDLRIPNHIKPAIGGLCTGIFGFFLPQTLAFGYGFAQQALENKLTIPFLLALAIGKVLTTSFSIGSGGSGGVFGPSIVIGGAMGGAVGNFFHQLMPGIVAEPGAFVVVGMAGFFTAVSNTPISTIIFVSEMTNSYHLLLPSLLVCSLTYMASRRWTIYHRQVKSRIDSAAHAGDFFVDILQTFKVKDLMERVRKVTLIPQEMPFLDFKNYFSETEQHYFPVMDKDGKLASIFSVNDIRAVLFAPEIEHLVVMKDIGTSDIIVTTPSDDLNSVLQKFTTKNIDSLPVVRDDDQKALIGLLSRREVIAFYNRQIQKMKSASGNKARG
jgi:CIC family chloride channel protein